MIKNKVFRTSMLALCILAMAMTSGCKKKDVAPEDKVDILLITDVGTVSDGSFNQGAWEGVLQYTAETGKVAKYYEPSDTSVDAYLEQIKTGVENGAEIVVCPGYLFGETVYEAQKKFKDTHFILLDGVPHNEDFSDETIGENVMSVQFEEDEAGFLAGYAAVRDGYTNLAFMGGIPEDAVIRFGYGFVQGADYASIEMGVPVYIRYTYTNTFYEDDSVEATAASWYDNGTEVIFACGGSMGRSVMRAAENHNGKIIGVDVDQHTESPTVITSAMKSLDSAVYEGLKAYYAGNFPGGEITVFSAKDAGVRLPMDTSRFNRFMISDYNAVYDLLVNDIIDPYSETNIGTCEELSLINTEVSYVVP